MSGLGMQLQQQQHRQPHNPMPPTVPGEPVPQIFILVGSPGVGKSTTVRVLASELGWTVHQWNDAQQDTPSGARSGGNGGYGRSSFDSAMSVRYQSQMKSFEEFLAAAGTGYTALDFGGGASGSSSGGGGMSKPLPVSKAGKKRKASSKATIDNDRAAPSNGGGAIILIEDIPNLYSPEAEATFRTIMAHHIHKSQTPTVLIFSDVSEGKHRPSDLERLIDPSVLYSPLARIFQIHGVAKPKMKKCLQAIVKQERFRGTSDLLYEELHATSKGDIRHAIMALQFQYASAGGGRVSSCMRSAKN
jgi:cell cycle checkpoint protein